ncbi:transcriptional regulator family: Fungal Specific TF [Paecilomyces variotii]|nr:transcriptional regulator family: Fungal Specific TF [Paecilomyces variotii]KAJ9334436.1 transcriptional regulator family: Fungal Specific TF [Paecilomyces variotii]
MVFLVGLAAKEATHRSVLTTWSPILDHDEAFQMTRHILHPQGARLLNPSQTALQDHHGGNLAECIYSGENSVVSILRLRTRDPNGDMARKAGSVLGLQNSYTSYPFMDPQTPQERWAALLKIIPRREEILKYFSFYRDSSYPFNPIIANIDRLESLLCTYLDAHAKGELRDPDKLSPNWASEKSAGFISLLLAVLAAGVHFSNLENPQRSELCLDFARRSFEGLRLANFFFRPSLDIIQSLLIIGNVLQNNGQSDAAWTLLGTTTRSAQVLGLHSEKIVSHWPQSTKDDARALWSSIVWQDTLLCICYDRPLLISTSDWVSDDQLLSISEPSYRDVMHVLCRVALEFSGRNNTLNMERRVELLQTIDNIYNRSQPHLRSRERCSNLHQHLEHLALAIHISLCISVVCRPVLKGSEAHTNSQYNLSMRAKGSLVDTAKAFIEFQALSTVPLKTWSMVHAVLSSTLLLCVWEETRNDPECRALQQKVIEIFSDVEPETDDPAVTISNNGQWLSPRHIRAVIALRDTVRSAPLAADDAEKVQRGTESIFHQQRRVNQNTYPANITGETGALSDTDSFSLPPGYWFSNDASIDSLDPVDLSPLAYLDSIMNAPLFDYPS